VGRDGWNVKQEINAHEYVRVLAPGLQKAVFGGQQQAKAGRRESKRGWWRRGKGTYQYVNTWWRADYPPSQADADALPTFCLTSIAGTSVPIDRIPVATRSGRTYVYIHACACLITVSYLLARVN
jgi:hypothetical protein